MVLDTAAAIVLSALLGLSPVGGEVLCEEGSGDPVPVSSSAGVDEELKALYRSGRSFTDFLGAATSRTELWQGNTGRAEEIDPSLVRRARAVGGTWYFLAVAVDACSDSVSTIPYLAHLVAMVPGLQMRIVDPTAGRALMESHRTPDGRPATPTVLLLDANYDEAGCFIERPPQLQTWILENSGWSGREVYERKMEWYDEDGGHGTVEAFVEMLEAAAEGESICR